MDGRTPPYPQAAPSDRYPMHGSTARPLVAAGEARPDALDHEREDK
jgi:hypothetical protein